MDIYITKRFPIHILCNRNEFTQIKLTNRHPLSLNFKETF